MARIFGDLEKGTSYGEAKLKHEIAGVFFSNDADVDGTTERLKQIRQSERELLA